MPDDPLAKSSLTDRPEYATAIGMITIELANLEIELGGLLGALLHIDPHFGRLVYLTPQNYAARLGMLENVTRDTIPEGSEARRQLEGIIGRARAYIGQRNDLVHNAWGTSPDDITQISRQPLPMRDEKPAQLVPIEHLNELLRKIRALVYEVIKTNEETYKNWPPYTWRETPLEPHARDPSEALPSHQADEAPKPSLPPEPSRA